MIRSIRPRKTPPAIGSRTSFTTTVYQHQASMIFSEAARAWRGKLPQLLSPPCGMRRRRSPKATTKHCGYWAPELGLML